MAQVTAQHIPAVTGGAIILLVGTLLGVAFLNHYANRH